MGNTTEIVEPIRGTSWFQIIGELGLYGEVSCPHKKATTIRPLISGRLSLAYPDRTFETTTGEVEGKKVLVVKRTS